MTYVTANQMDNILIDSVLDEIQFTPTDLRYKMFILDDNGFLSHTKAFRWVMKQSVTHTAAKLTNINRA